MTKEHSCTSSGRRETSTPTNSWVSCQALPILIKKLHIGTKELQMTLQDKNNYIIAYETICKGKEKTLAQLYESWEESFQLLLRWKEAALEKMSDSVIEIDLHVEEGKLFFKRFFCAFGSCLEGFREGCRSYLSVDSTALNGR
jgi:hypothetical protein